MIEKSKGIVLKILSLDGGGIRGLYTLSILSRLETEISLFDSFDGFAGTSSGSIFAAALAMGLKAKDLVAIYSDLGPSIFLPNSNLKGAKYSLSHLEKALGQTLFKDKPTFNSLQKKLLIPIYSIEEQKGVLISNLASETLEVSKAVIGSSSLPIYFPSYETMLDGGLSAPSPALDVAINLIESGVDHPNILSIGTGELPLNLPSDLDWSKEEWMEDKPEKRVENVLLALLLQANQQRSDDLCSKLLGKNFHKVNTQFQQFIGVDEVSKAQEIFDEAEKTNLDQTVSWIKQL